MGLASGGDVALRRGKLAWLLPVVWSLSCGKTTREPDPAAGPGTGGHTAGATTTSTDRAPGTSPGVGGSTTATNGGGTGGTAPACSEAVKPLVAIEQRGGRVVTWPDSPLIAVSSPRAIDIYDSTLPDEEVSSAVIQLNAESLGLSDDDELTAVEAYGSGLAVAIGRPVLSVIEFVDLEGTELRPPVTVDDTVYRFRVTSERIAVSRNGGVYVGRFDQDDWVWAGPIRYEDRYAFPLAFDGDSLFVSVSEGYGSAGAGGAGGADPGSHFSSARLERANDAAEVLESFETVGNPERLVRVDDGWLVTESNSYWGSYEAALEWLPSERGELATLTQVPVISAGDGADGAMDAAVYGDRLYVANCESGLLSGLWSRQTLELEPVTAHPAAESGRCDPQWLGIATDLLVTTGRSLFMARLCER